MTTIPLSVAEIIAVVFIALPALCVAASLSASHFYTRWQRRSMNRREKDITFRNELLTERAKVLMAWDASLSKREENVVVMEQNLRRSAKEAAAAMNREEEHFDTMISVLDADDFPKPFENADTVAVPTLQELNEGPTEEALQRQADHLNDLYHRYRMEHPDGEYEPTAAELEEHYADTVAMRLEDQ